MRYKTFGMIFAGALLFYYFIAVGLAPAVVRLLGKAWRVVMAEAKS